MNIIVANKDDYIKFNARIINKIHYFELTNDIKDYIIHRVSLGNNSHDVSSMDSCINNLLDEQYEKGKYILEGKIEKYKKHRKTRNGSGQHWATDGKLQLYVALCEK